LQQGIDNPIYKLIEGMPKTEELVVADLGAGTGDLLFFLSMQFKRVYAIDFSEKMLNIAKEKFIGKKNITFKQGDIRDLSKLGLKLDIAIAINSILCPSINDVNKILKEVYDSLKSEGLFIAIFPAMEAVLYHSLLLYENELSKGGDEDLIIKNINRRVGKEYCFIPGIFRDKDEKQKFFYKFELERRLKNAGFKHIKFKKVYYPWGQHGDFESFPNETMMWDWFVFAKKI